MRNITIGCLVFASVAAVFYFLMGAGIITAGELSGEDAPPAVPFIAGSFYLLGGILILLRNRKFLIAGLFINTLVIAFFFLAYAHKPEVIFSIPGLGTKIAQITLEAGLVYLIANPRRKLLLVN